MKWNRLSRFGSLILVTSLVTAASQPMWAEDPKATYASMAPLEQYLMERNAEIALARSAAPAAISREAEILVLGRKDYEAAIKGKNGFVCVVERSWEADFDLSLIHI